MPMFHSGSCVVRFPLPQFLNRPSALLRAEAPFLDEDELAIPVAVPIRAPTRLVAPPKGRKVC